VTLKRSHAASPLDDARVRGEGFTAGPNDIIPDLEEIGKQQPHWLLALVPLVVVIATIVAPRIVSLTAAGSTIPLVEFANAQPILWPSIALFAGSLLAIALFQQARRVPLEILGAGTQDAINPLMATAAVIGFGGVVVQTATFADFTTALLDADMPPLLSMFTGISTVSGITGSASGGLQIFMSTMADAYLAMGIDRGELHRLAAMASGGFDSLPHSGAVIATLAITQLSHREAYKDIGIITVCIPVIATLCATGLAMVL